MNRGMIKKFVIFVVCLFLISFITNRTIINRISNSSAYSDDYVAFVVEIIEITDYWFLVQDVTDTRRFEIINHADLPEIGVTVGDTVEVIIRKSDFDDTDSTPLHVREWSLREN